MSIVILSVISVSVIALLCGILLVVAAKFMAVEEDPLFAPVRECLPGANCGACGYAGCDGYANALAAGEEKRTNLCVPGGNACSAAIAAVLNVEAATVEEKIAAVFCGGDCTKTTGEGKNKSCQYGCTGCGACSALCPNGAIQISNGIAKVTKELCTGCGMCAKTCPKQVIRMLPKHQKVFDCCSNPEKGKPVMDVCKAGCIGCTKCSKVCPAAAITMDGNLAVVDADKCTGCGTCVESCPTKCMHLI